MYFFVGQLHYSDLGRKLARQNLVVREWYHDTQHVGLICDTQHSSIERRYAECHVFAVSWGPETCLWLGL